MNGIWRNGKFVLASTIEERERLDAQYIGLLEAGLRAVGDLIDDSAGVAGLHLNGDLAEWGSLRTGGRFAEWLGPFDEALKAMVTRSPSNEG